MVVSEGENRRVTFQYGEIDVRACRFVYGNPSPSLQSGCCGLQDSNLDSVQKARRKLHLAAELRSTMKMLSQKLQKDNLFPKETIFVTCLRIHLRGNYHYRLYRYEFIGSDTLRVSPRAGAPPIRDLRAVFALTVLK
ncbi:hypothetical protein TNCV_1643781 [Trichonephila clavipes]|nr:hypothetical protein TNCV_1643781 [Trichonephila clavipes]